MIRLMRLNGSEYFLNCELIETIEATPDTVITTTDGHRFIVRDSVDDIVAKIIDYKRQINACVADVGTLLSE